MRIADMPLIGDEGSVNEVQRHVIPRAKGWAVKKAGSDRATAVFGTKTEALAYGIGVCRHQDGVLVIHRRDGRVQDTRSYGS